MRTIFRLSVILVLIIPTIAVGRNIASQLSKFKEIYQADKKVQQLSKEQADLKARLEKGNSPSFVEKEARNKLGFQQPGETLYVVDMEREQANQQRVVDKKNWQAWVDLLFH